MRKFNLTWGGMLAAVVLLGYTYIAFLGMLYKFDGDIWKALLCAVGIVAAVSACVYVMVSAKVTKNKLAGLYGQILFGVVILLVFLSSGGPFSSFLKVAVSSKQIETQIENVRESAARFDDDYNQYATKRIEDYRKSLPNADELKVKSFQRRLTPDSITVIQKQRQNWVAQIGKMSIWNISLPQNLQYMKQCIADWTRNYSDLSAFAYDDQQLEPFQYSTFDTSLDNLMNSVKKADYSLWAVIVAILCASVMMIPYWVAIPSKTKKRTDTEIRYY